MAINTMLQGIHHVGALVRISDEKKDAQGKRVTFEETLKNHKAKITEFCQDNKLKVTFFEEVLSGGSALEKRTELNDLLDQLENFDAIVVIELPRLARQGTISQHIKQKVILHRKLIIQLNPFVIYNMAEKPMDAMFYDFGSAIAEYERRVIGERIKINKQIMAKEGLYATGAVPYGYKRNPKTKRLEIIEAEAKVVRKMFNLVLEGYGARQIADELDLAGYRTKKGNHFVKPVVNAMLKRKVYKGWIVWKNSVKKGNKTEVIDVIEAPDAHVPIIEPELFDQVQQIINNRAERAAGDPERNLREGAAAHPSSLKDLMFCSECGRKKPVIWEKKKQKHMIRKCSETNAETNEICSNAGMIATEIEAALLQKVFSYQEELEQKLKDLKNNDTKNYQLELEEKLAELDNQMKKLLMEFKIIREDEKQMKMNKIEGNYDAAEAQAIAEDKEENFNSRIKVQQKLDKVKEQLENIPAPEKEMKRVKANINIIKQIKKNPEPEKMNFLLKQIIHKVYFTRLIPEGTGAHFRKNYPCTLKVEYIQ